MMLAEPWKSLANNPAAAVWRHFSALCLIPRPSKGEAAIREHLQMWASAQGLDHETDLVGNLIIKKPASLGYENVPGLILQGHLDMVCQANSGTSHDFTRDPITPVLQTIDGKVWLVAPDTTLGADNGIGVALALALLEDNSAQHPALEVLLTVDEEAGMGGALGLEAHRLTGRRLINLDTEEWGQLYIGCAGGIDVNIDFDYPEQTVPAGNLIYALKIAGLKGGHSGVDIHLERGNAIKLLWRVLRDLDTKFNIHLIRFSGGTARNALAREAVCHLAVDAQANNIQTAILEWEQRLNDELSGVETNLSLMLEKISATSEQCIEATAQQSMIAAFNGAPHGVYRMSQAVPGVVETSNNLGMIELANGTDRS
jgi:dipeptidase D